MPKQLWKPGQSGNPKGRPLKGLTIAENVGYEGDIELDQDLIVDARFIAKKGQTQRKAMIAKLYKLALFGSFANANTIRAIEILLDREYGKALDHLAITHDEEEEPTTEELEELIKLRREQDGPEGNTA
jgi:hypothetical protein